MRNFGHITTVLEKDDKKFAFACTIDDQQVYLNEKLLVYSDQDLIKNKVYTFVMTEGADGFFGKKAKLLEVEDDFDTLNYILVKTIKLQFQHLYKEPLRLGFGHYIDLIIDNYEELSALKSKLIKNIDSIVDGVRFKDDLDDLVRYFEFYNLYFPDNIDEFVNELERLVSTEYLKELWLLGLPIKLDVEDACSLFLAVSTNRRAVEHLNALEEAEILSAKDKILDGFAKKLKEFSSYEGWPIQSNQRFKLLLQDIVYLTLSDDLQWLDSQLLQSKLKELATFDLQLKLRLRGARIELDLSELANYIINNSASHLINPEVLVKIFKSQEYLDRILIEEGKKEFIKLFANSSTIEVVLEVYQVLEKYVSKVQMSFVVNWIEKNASPELHLDLWLKGIIQRLPYEILSNLVVDNKINSQVKEKLIRATPNEKNELSNKLYLELDAKLEDETIKSSEYKRYLTEVSDLLPPFRELAEKLVADFAKPYVKLELWAERLIEDFNFIEYQPYVFTLSGEKQQYFFKWSLRLISEGVLNISTEDYLKTFTIDKDEVNRALGLQAGSETILEFSTNVLLRLLSKLNSQSFEIKGLKQAYKKTLFEIAAESVSDPKQIPYLNGYFDKCAGRCLIDEKNEKGEVKLTRHSEFSPQRHEICDGYRAILPNGEMNRDKEHQEFFFWCGGGPCFETNRKLKSYDDWENYSILDFLTILKISYDERQLEILLGVINKANEFWSHLKCRSCSHLLYPTGHANLTFWSVNTFTCRNEHCEKVGEGVYINHCLNGLCESVIDGRDSSRCIPIGSDDASGPYVCNYCLSCCSDGMFARRAQAFKINNKEYRGPTIGHRNKSVSCNKCGHSMGSGSILADKHNKLLEKLLSGESDNRIVKQGVGPAGKHWFILRKLDSETEEEWKVVKQKVYKLGFSFGKDGNTKSDTQFIGEPYQSVLEILRNRYNCGHCGNSIDLSEDKARETAFRNFHEQAERQ